jgi:hypothetical protein
MTEVVEVKKNLFKSKTLWVNAIVAISQFFPGMKDIVTPDAMLQLMLVINFVLRLVTKDKISLS